LNNLNTQSFIRSIDASIKKNDLRKALNDIHDIVLINNINKSIKIDLLGSITLDNLCSKIGQISYTKIIKEKSKLLKHKNVNLYIATRLEKFGGHSRLLKDFIDVFPEKNHVILITDKIPKKDYEFFNNFLLYKKNVSVQLSLDASRENKLIWLQKKIIQVSPENIFLFNHNQDSAAVAAIQPEMNIPTYFFHHADHSFSLGLFLKNVTHIDLHKHIYENCKNLLGIHSTYLHLYSNDKGVKKSQFMKDGYLITATAGGRNKIEKPYFIDYTNAIPMLLKSTKGKHIHIGALSVWALLKLRFNLLRSNLRQDQLIYLPWVPSVWDELKSRNVDLYLNSFPFGGGLSIVEAMGAGIPLAIHSHNNIKFYTKGSLGIAYPDVFAWKRLEDLINFCAQLTPTKLMKLSNVARSYYLKNYNSESLRGKVIQERHSLKKIKINESLKKEELLFTRYLQRGIFEKILFSLRKSLSGAKHFFL
jgi:hypothetical protein